MDVRRLIAPLTERWNEGERDWAFVKDPNHDIARWEESTGLSLPDGYRGFMLRFNGGRVYPRLFGRWFPRRVHHLQRPVLFVDESRTLGALKFSCRFVRRITDIFFCWFHSTNIWGTDDNDRIWYQAASFEAFLGSLHDEPDGSDYESWRTPLFDKLAKPLVF